MSASEGDDDTQNTRPISVAELLARNGTIGAPPVGGHRRRRRGRQSVSVSELTGEIPVIQDVPEVDETVVAEGAAVVEDAAVVEETLVEEAVVIEAEPADAGMTVEYVSDSGDATTAVVIEGDAEVVAVDEVVVEAEEAAEEVEEVADAEEIEEADEAPEEAPEVEEALEVGEVAEPVEVARADTSPPLSGDPLPRRGGGPELSHDPRPVRRGLGAEQMTYDPVDQSVDLADLVGDQAEEAEELRAYLQSSSGTLFGGETVADDLARRGVATDSVDGSGAAAEARPAARVKGGSLAALRNAVMAVLQSVLAVAFGAGLFLGFDQLWRWNTIVALVLSVLVILGLVVAVRVVRKTEDIASTLIAVAVGALVTLGPLALLQST